MSDASAEGCRLREWPPGRRFAAIVALVAMPAGASWAEAQGTQNAATSPALERVSWLAGCWAGAAGGNEFDEQWSKPRGGTMVAASRATRGGRTVTVELVVLRHRGDTLAYEAHPVGQTATTFLATAVADDSVAFANPQHDFPQRIVYRRVGRDSLDARIEGPRDGRTATVRYPMRRVACPGGK